MALTTTTNWQFSFYYEQDLRSKYMNHILSGVLQPGIYNAGLEVLYYNEPDPTLTEKNSGWYLLIKKGTTLVFRNGYSASEGSLKRDLDSLGTYTIKCTAQDDMYIRLGVEENATTIFPYVIAKVIYNEEESVGFREPVFTLARLRNDDDKDIANTFIEKDTSSDSIYSIPDGKGNTASYKNVSWLMLGYLNNVNVTKDAESKISGTAGDFIARGLPEYSKSSMISTSPTQASLISTAMYGVNYLPIPVLNKTWIDNDICSYNTTFPRDSFYKLLSEEDIKTLPQVNKEDNGLLVGYLYREENSQSSPIFATKLLVDTGITFPVKSTQSVMLDIDVRNINHTVEAIQNKNILNLVAKTIRDSISNTDYPFVAKTIVPLFIAEVVEGQVISNHIIDLIDLQSGRNALPHLAFSSSQYLSTVNVLVD